MPEVEQERGDAAKGVSIVIDKRRMKVRRVVGASGPSLRLSTWRLADDYRSDDDAADADADAQPICAFCRKAAEPFSNGALPDDRNDMIGPYLVHISSTRCEYAYAHYICALWSPRVFVESGSGRIMNVAEEIRRARGLYCDVCRKSGASIGCYEAKCRRCFHLECAEKALCFLNRSTYSMMCGECGSVDFFQRNFADLDPNLLLDATARQMYSIVLYNRSASSHSRSLDGEEAFRAAASAAAAAAAAVPARIPDVDFEHVCGLDDAVRSLKESVMLPLMYPELIKQWAITPPRGVLLYGPPGTGKTLLARALVGACSKMCTDAGTAKVSFFARKGADVLSRYHGESERNLRELFAKAKENAPSVIFFDEIDGLVPPRSARQNQVHSSVVCTLLSLMDGLDGIGQVFVLAATNRVSNVDPALRRPGRFDREIFVPLPDLDAKKLMLRRQARMLDPHDIDEIASHCHGFSGAHVRAICAEAVLAAVRSLRENERRENRNKDSEASADWSFTYDGLRQLKVTRVHFLQALAHVNAAATFASSSSSATAFDSPDQLPACLKALLQPCVDQVLDCLAVHVQRVDADPDAASVPFEYACGNKVLIEGLSGHGQQHVLRAVLFHLQQYHREVIHIGGEHDAAAKIVATFDALYSSTSATSASLSVLAIPNIDRWWTVVPPDARAALYMCFSRRWGGQPPLIIATSTSVQHGHVPVVAPSFQRVRIATTSDASDEVLLGVVAAILRQPALEMASARPFFEWLRRHNAEAIERVDLDFRAAAQRLGRLTSVPLSTCLDVLHDCICAHR